LALWRLLPDRNILDHFWLMLRDRSCAAACTDGTTSDNVLLLTHLILILGTEAPSLLCSFRHSLQTKRERERVLCRGHLCPSVTLPKSLDILKLITGRTLAPEVAEQIKFSTILSDDKVHFT
jgi:hypothetical protein